MLKLHVINPGRSLLSVGTSGMSKQFGASCLWAVKGNGDHTDAFEHILAPAFARRNLSHYLMNYFAESLLEFTMNRS